MSLPVGVVDLSTAISLTTLVAAAGIFVTSLEDLVDLRLFRPSGLLSWNVLRLQDSWSVRGWSGKLGSVLFGYAGVKTLVVMRLVAATALLLFGRNAHVFSIGCLVVLLSLVALSIRGVYGLDGAHQMSIVIFGALSLGGVAGQDSIGQVAGVWFIAAQAAMAYFISGVNKLASSAWRSGDALLGVLGTQTYGHSGAYSLISASPVLARLLCWSVIVFESCFCLVFIVHDGAMFSILIAGIAFHFSIAVLMGLNGFFLAFVATYPCIAYCVSVLHS